LTVFGFTGVLAKLGLGREPSAGERSPAQIAGYLAFVGILFFAAIEAARKLGFDLLAAPVSILVLAGTMALRQMGLADGIIHIAFGLLLGSIAVIFALDFGLGAQEIAARELGERAIIRSSLGKKHRGGWFHVERV